RVRRRSCRPRPRRPGSRGRSHSCRSWESGGWCSSINGIRTTLMMLFLRPRRGWSYRKLAGREDSTKLFAIEIPFGSVVLAFLEQGPDFLRVSVQDFSLFSHLFLLSGDLL